MGKLPVFSGMLRVAVESADLPGLMSAVNDRGISLFSAYFRDDVTLLMDIRRQDWKTVSQLCKTRGENIKLLKRKGLYWNVKRLANRPVLILGMVMLLALIFYLPSRVLFIQVTGCRNVPANQILEAAESCGIRFGASRRGVRSERVKNKLLEAMPQLQWAGVNTKGCVAVISVRERKMESPKTGEGIVSGIVAVRDGIVRSCTATKGQLLCAPGQAVRKGQLLISGFTDCGLTILATSAEGEVFAQTRQSGTAMIPSECRKRAGEKGIRRNYSVMLGKKRINFWKDSGIWDTSCGRIYSEYYVTLPGGLKLPFGIAVEEITEFISKDTEISPDEARVVLEDSLPKYLNTQMIAGQIRSRDEVFSSGPGIYELAGQYVCTEMIGRVQREQIGEQHG